MGRPMSDEVPKSGSSGRMAEGRGASPGQRTAVLAERHPRARHARVMFAFVGVSRRPEVELEEEVDSARGSARGWRSAARGGVYFCGRGDGRSAGGSALSWMRGRGLHGGHLV